MYRQCIRIILDDTLPKNNYEFKANVDFLSDQQPATHQNANFETISVDDKPDKILRILLMSLKNLRKNIAQVDLT